VDKLIKEFPEDTILKIFYDSNKKAQRIQQLTKLLKYADGDRLYPNYNFMCESSHRTAAAQPELHNLSTKVPRFFIQPDEDPTLYNIRNLLYAAPNVFELDFSQQEARYMAYKTQEPALVKTFLDNQDPAQKVADDLNITRAQAKTVLYGLPYGRGVKDLSKKLNIPLTQAEIISNNFREKYPILQEYIKELKLLDKVKSPLLGRTVRFSRYKEYTKFNWLIQGGCVDLLLVALDYVLDHEEVELRGHYHDSLVLACLCSEFHPGCSTATRIRQELEKLYDFYWPNTNIRILKFGEVEWTEKGG